MRFNCNLKKGIAAMDATDKLLVRVYAALLVVMLVCTAMLTCVVPGTLFATVPANAITIALILNRLGLWGVE